MEMISGAEMGLPLITHIGTSQIHAARPAQTWHAHDGFELLFITGGATAWDFQEGPTVEVTGGHFLVVPPGRVHRCNLAMRRPSSVCGLLFKPDCPEGWRQSTLTRGDLARLGRDFAQAAISTVRMARELSSRVQRLVAVKRALELDPGNPMLQASLRTLACAVILEAAQGLSPASPAASPAVVVAAAREYLGAHLREPVSISALVDRMGFSRSYLFAIFKSVTGMTPNDYYVRLRITKAQQLLEGTTKPVTAIALETGFSSSQYFSSVFRKYTGQTPLEYRHSNGPAFARCMKSSTELFRKTLSHVS